MASSTMRLTRLVIAISSPAKASPRRVAVLDNVEASISAARRVRDASAVALATPDLTEPSVH